MTAARRGPILPRLAASREIPGPGDSLEQLRSVHLAMVDAVLGGEGLGRVAQLAAEALSAPVAIVVPRLAVACVAPAAAEPAELERYVADRVADRESRRPASIALEAPISAGEELVGLVALLASDAPVPAEAAAYLHLAAVASLTEVAVAEAKEEVVANLHGSFIEELRNRQDLEAAEIVRRAARLGCELVRGLVVLCAELSGERPAHAVATIRGEWPGALAQLDQGTPGHAPRVYALLPATGADGAPEETLAAARRLAARLQRLGTVGLSSFYADPGALPRAIQEAELVLDVVRSSGAPLAHDIGSGAYRLLFRVLASHPEEVRSFYDDTVEPLVRYDEQYRTDLLATLEAYLANNCNMNATATAIYAHRHTVAYRLERVKELTGLDPLLSEDRERLGLGLKAYRVILPRLPR